QAEDGIRDSSVTGVQTCALPISHAYTRYLGDLSGGQIIKKILARSLALPPEALSFYEFPEIADIRRFKDAYRDVLELAGAAMAEIGRASCREGVWVWVAEGRSRT